MSPEVLKRSLEGLYAELAERELKFHNLATHERNFHFKNVRGSRLELYARGVALIREIRKLRIIISEVSFLVYYKNLSL